MPTLTLGLSPQLQLLTSGDPRIKLQVQDAGLTRSNSQDLFQGLSKQKNLLEEKEGPPELALRWCPMQPGCLGAHLSVGAPSLPAAPPVPLPALPIPQAASVIF